MFSPTPYARIRLSDGKIVDIQVSKETDKMISGFKVNKEGERSVRVTKDAETSTLIVAHPDNVVARLRMNLHYGMLEQVSDDS